MRLLKRFRNDIAGGEIVVLPVKLPTVLGEHWDDRLYCLFPTVALVANANAERMQFRGPRALTKTQFNAAAGNLIERGNTFRHAMRLIGGDLHDAMTEPNALRALAGGGEKH